MGCAARVFRKVLRLDPPGVFLPLCYQERPGDFWRAASRGAGSGGALMAGPAGVPGPQD